MDGNNPDRGPNVEGWIFWILVFAWKLTPWLVAIAAGAALTFCFV